MSHEIVAGPYHPGNARLAANQPTVSMSISRTAASFYDVRSGLELLRVQIPTSSVSARAVQMMVDRHGFKATVFPSASLPPPVAGLDSRFLIALKHDALMVFGLTDQQGMQAASYAVQPTSAITVDGEHLPGTWIGSAELQIAQFPPDVKDMCVGWASGVLAFGTREAVLGALNAGPAWRVQVKP